MYLSEGTASQRSPNAMSQTSSRDASRRSSPRSRPGAATALFAAALMVWAVVALSPLTPRLGVPGVDGRGTGALEPDVGAASESPGGGSDGADSAGAPPSATLTSSVSEIDFGTVPIGQSASRRVVLTNNALDDTTITVAATWLSEPDALEFASGFRGPVGVPAGESIAIELEFSPGEAGHRVGALYVSHDGATNLDIFTLSGNGAAAERERALMRRAKPGANAPRFGKSTLKNLGDVKPTSLQFGPDGRLYVADMLGLIKVFDVEREGDNDYRVTATETITAIRDIPNHDDDGKPNPKIRSRLVTGILVTGTATRPVVYVGSSDPRIGGGPSHTETHLDTNSGIISRLVRKPSGKGWDKLDLVRGLPRSEENHHPNGMALDAATNRLYVSAGGNTNQGAISNNFAKLPEYALSAAILEIDLGLIGESTYDLPTLDDETRGGAHDANDPFGGNDGRNQAKLVPGGPVQVYAPGFRNAYDVVLTESGRMYSIDNGPNGNWGGRPIKEGAGGNCTNGQHEPSVTYHDSLHHITGRGYYGGHSNPTRGNLANTFNTNDPQSPVSVANPIECDYYPAGGKAALTTFGTSVNGMVEYRASNFGGAMKGDLLAAGFNDIVYRLKLSEDGTRMVDKDPLFANVAEIPLDVTAQADHQRFPGTVWTADFVGKKVIVFEPVDFDGNVADVCQAGKGGPGDDDGDGFSNADELANGTDPCSEADQPGDLDDDGVSDRLDTDDDGDGLADKADPFALDAANGRGTSLPLSYTWENDSASAGFLFNLGFSGLMNDGRTDYLDRFDVEKLTAGGAAGVFTIDDVPPGDAIAGVNDQAFGFQFGVDVTPDTPVFTVRTRVLAPFTGAKIGGFQSAGLYIGTGDQDNYIKLVASSFGPGGSVEFAAERSGRFQTVERAAAPVLGSDQIDLFLTVDPAAGTVTAFRQSKLDGKNGAIVQVGGATALPRSWLSGKSGLAIGIISTSFGGEPFGATWDFVDVAYGRIGAGSGGGTAGGTAGGTDGSNGAGTVHGALNGTIAIEAERFAARADTATHRWRAGSRGGASGGSMFATPDAGALALGKNGSPQLRYAVEFPSAGTWTVWVRGWGDADPSGEGKGDSVHVGLNGQLSTGAAMDGFPAGGWAWSKSRRGGGAATVSVPSAGEHTLEVWMREDGFELDRLVLTKSGGYVPKGSGPATRYVDGSNGGTSGTAGGGASDGGSSGGSTGATTGSGAGATDGTDGGAGGSGGATSGTSAGGTSTDGGSATGANGGTGGGSGGGAGGGTDGGNGAGTVHGALNGTIAIEAERFAARADTATHRWRAGSLGGASGGSMFATPDAGALSPGKDGSPQLRYAVEFPSAGTWTVWVRGWGDADPSGEGKGDSVHVGLNGQLSTGAAMDGFPAGGWAWSKSRRGGGAATVSVPSAGEHTLEVWMREDGFELDRLVLTKSGGYVPGGTGPAVRYVDGSTSGSGDGPAGGSTGSNGIGGDGLRANASIDWQGVSSADGSRAVARHEAGAVAMGGKLYLLGGRGQRPVSIFDPATKRWSQGAAPPFEMHHFQPVAYGNRIYVAGAMSCCYPREKNVENVWTYTPSTNRWEKGAAVPASRQRGSAAAVVHDGKIYLVGGNTRGHDGGAVGWFDEYDPKSGKWRTLSDTPAARDHMQAGLIGGKLVVSAGRRSTQPDVFENTVSRVDVYDFATGKWAGRQTSRPSAPVRWPSTWAASCS